LASLHNKREQEHYRKAIWEYIQLLLKTIDKEPQEQGYEFCRWMGERLATYLGLAEKVTQKEHKDQLTNEVVLNNKLFSGSFTHRLLFLILHPPKVASAPN